MLSLSLSLSVHIRARARVCVCVYIYIYIYICVCVCVRSFAWICVCAESLYTVFELVHIDMDSHRKIQEDAFTCTLRQVPVQKSCHKP